MFLETKGAAAAGESFYIVLTDARLQGQWVERTLPVLLRWRSHLHETCVAAASRTAPGSWVRGGHRTRRVGRADSTEATPKVSLGEGVTFTKSHSGSRCDMSPASALRAVPPPPHATPTCPARRARRSGWICEVAPPLTDVGQRVERSSKGVGSCQEWTLQILCAFWAMAAPFLLNPSRNRSASGGACGGLVLPKSGHSSPFSFTRCPGWTFVFIGSQ